MDGSSPVRGPLRRQANHVILLFLLINFGLVLRATLPLPGKWHGPWPWRMFERRTSWERTLRATGITRSGERRDLPLDAIFGYARGTTPLYAYHQLEALGDPAAVSAHAALAAYLARRAKELGIELTAIDLLWLVSDLETGQTEERHIGLFSVGSRP
jgi:hypothetical protein